MVRISVNFQIIALSVGSLGGCSSSATQGRGTLVTVTTETEVTAQGQGAQRVPEPRRARPLRPNERAVALQVAIEPRTRCYAPDERHPQEVTDLSAGRWHTCVVLRDASVRCWGWNYDGQLGVGTRSGHNAPVVLDGLGQVASVHAAWDFTCARHTTGTVSCWGENDYGQLGDGDRHTRERPHPVAGLTHVRQLAMGSTHACALQENGHVACWGRNEFGELGDGSATLRTRPVRARFANDLGALAAGEGGTCALSQRGTVQCAGWQGRGALPAPIEGLPSGVIDLRMSRNFACANTVDDAPRCWGEGFAGQLGGANTTEVFVPREIEGLTQVTQMSLGARGGCAVRRDGSLMCWGRVGSRARRDAAPDETVGRAPYRIEALAGVAQVALGDDFVCARMNAGGVCCFGDGHMGQLGDNGTHNAPETAPVAVRW
ncbi:MAG: hypothetical protein Q8Q09_14285 [Deltaproteobacteria bacterium]|nr:hypothetical protein [Deltaproteobacteria bacterium]